MDWAAIPLSKSSLEHLSEWDVETGGNIHHLMNKCLQEIAYIRTIERLSVNCVEECEKNFLNEISDEEELPTDERCPAESSKLDSSESSCIQANQPLPSCTVEELIADLTKAVDKSSENKELWITLSNSQESDVVNILKHVWNRSSDNGMKEIVYFIQNKNFVSPELFWKEVVFHWYSKEAEPLTVLGRIASFGFLLDSAFFEGFASSVLKRDLSEDNIETVTKLIDLLPEEMKLLGLGVFLRNISGSLQPHHLSVIAKFLDAVITVDEETLKIIAHVLSENVVGLKNNRQMGTVLISLLGKLQPGMESAQQVVSVCSKYVGAMRFRIAKAIKDLNI